MIFGMHTSRNTCYLILLAALFLSQPVWAETITGRVVSVADGDTVTVLDANNDQHKIRLSGIDAPEKGMHFGQKSKDYLAAMTFGKGVEVETDKEDRYRRKVGKIYSDGRDVNLAMIVAGLAWHYKKYQSEQSASDQLLYASAEERARERRTGLWLDPEPTAPWEWRANRKP